MIIYELTVGFNDKQTKTQLLTDRQIINKIESILKKQTNGYSIKKTIGGYKHSNGYFIKEKSASIELAYIDKKTVKNIMDSLKIELNQESILFQKKKIKGFYY